MISQTSLNVKKLYVINSLQWFMLFMPTIVLFFQENGLSMAQVLALQAIFAVTGVLLQVPLGHFADMKGRKPAIILGSVFLLAGIISYSLSHSFIQFVLAEIFNGIGVGFASGAESALLYDSLIELKKEKEYMRLEGRLLSVGNFSEGSASIIGGLIALLSLRAPFYFDIPLYVIAIAVAFTLKEPEINKSPGGRIIELRELKSAVSYAFHTPLLKWLIFYSSIIGASTLVFVWFIQPYLKTAGLPLALFGIVWASLQFFAGFFSVKASRIERRLGRKRILLTLVFLSFATYLLLGLFQTLWVVPLLFIPYFVRGINGPVLKDYINRITSSSRRATVLSITRMLTLLMFSLLGPFLGWINDKYTMRSAFFAGGFIFLLAGVFTLALLKRENGF